jgi:hypothetical protein
LAFANTYINYQLILKVKSFTKLCEEHSEADDALPSVSLKSSELSAEDILVGSVLVQMLNFDCVCAQVSVSISSNAVSTGGVGARDKRLLLDNINAVIKNSRINF